MTEISLEQARQIIAKALTKGGEMGLKPLSVVVLDAGGHVKAFERAGRRLARPLRDRAGQGLRRRDAGHGRQRRRWRGPSSRPISWRR